MSGESVFRVSRWRGLNENPDGVTALASGEACEMTNFRVTTDGALRLRPGYRVISPPDRAWGAIRGIWRGEIAGREAIVFASDRKLWEFDAETGDAAAVCCEGGEVFTADAETHFFAFGGNLYAMNGTDYVEWDGGGDAVHVTGYRPLAFVSCPPSGGGTELEQVNLLTGARRVRFSPTGTAKVFQLPEGSLSSVDYVKNLATGEDYAASAYSGNLAGGVVTFTTAPAVGTDSLEIGYTVANTLRGGVTAMRWSEIFNGATDNRVFLYGDGSNRTVYSGLDYDGISRADYFPALNVLHIGVDNTPITSMVRHGTKLDAFKSDGAFTVTFGLLTLADDRVISAFYHMPLSRAIGNDAAGQAITAMNSPRTLHDGAVYEWKGGSGSSSVAHISSRVALTLGGMDLKSARTFVDPYRYEYYVLSGGTAVVNGFLTDAWYVYRDFDFERLIAAGGELYGVKPSGDIALISERYRSDGGARIDASWVSGAMSFGQDYSRKYSGRVYIALKPEQHSRLSVSVRTDKTGFAVDSAVAASLATFTGADFRHWSFNTNRQPRVTRLKIPARKFSYYQLVLKSGDDWSTATAVAADIRLRYAGEVR
ncbi:MAG: hypothetical protein LBN02_04130 [Oscillospiraceae bacterium]|jgi:hypothetical protein|nr:hypothetical protein [Oscillospiraceae bacterium]